eukprot:scaffold1467_cov264-Pinguiococcus_pyrenoidosus.AAC.6
MLSSSATIKSFKAYEMRQKQRKLLERGSALFLPPQRPTHSSLYYPRTWPGRLPRRDFRMPA